MRPDVHGTVQPAFEGVREAFAANFERGEIGAGLCVHVAGERVVDLWAGYADRDTGRPWEADTPAVVFSGTKGLTAVAYLVLADRGGIDLDAPVTRYWPEFAGLRRDAITVRMLLNHRSGLCAVDRPLSLQDLADPARTEAALLAQEPLWEPGTDQGYGATAWGMYAQAVFRRAAGRTIGRFLADEVAGPARADVWLGLPESVNTRAATLYPTPLSEAARWLLTNLPRGTSEGRTFRDVLLHPNRASWRAVRNPRELGLRYFHHLDRYDVRKLELPWIGGFATARGFATLYDPLANGGVRADGTRLVSAAAIDAVKARQSWTERDRVMHKPIGFAQGFVKEQTCFFSPNPEAFGHPGMGGSLGFADPVDRVSIGYVVNSMAAQVRSPRAISLCRAIYRGLGRELSPL